MHAAEACHMQDDMIRVELLLQATSDALESVAAELDARESQTEALNALTEDLFLKIAGVTIAAPTLPIRTHTSSNPMTIHSTERDISLDDFEERIATMQTEHNAATQALQAELDARARPEAFDGAWLGSPSEDRSATLGEVMNHQQEHQTPEHEMSALEEHLEPLVAAKPSACRRRIDFVPPISVPAAIPPTTDASTAIALTAADLRKSALAAPGINLAAWLAVRVVICRLGLALFRQPSVGEAPPSLPSRIVRVKE